MTTDEKLDLILNKVTALESDMKEVKGEIVGINKRLDTIEIRLNTIQEDVDHLKRRMDELDSGMNLVIIKLNNLKHWTNLDEALKEPRLRRSFNLQAEA